MIPAPHYYVFFPEENEKYFFVFRKFLKNGRYYSGCLGGKLKPEPLDHTKEGLARYF